MTLNGLQAFLKFAFFLYQPPRLQLDTHFLGYTSWYTLWILRQYTSSSLTIEKQTHAQTYSNLQTDIRIFKQIFESYIIILMGSV